MIDIHTHLLNNVDDGSKSLEQSLTYLNQAKKIGLNKIVCTPHMHRENKDKVKKIIIVIIIPITPVLFFLNKSNASFHYFFLFNKTVFKVSKFSKVFAVPLTTHSTAFSATYTGISVL